MRQRLTRACLCSAAVVGLAGAASAATADISVTPIARDNQVVVSFDSGDGFTREVREAIQSGLATTLSYEVELRSVSSWLDRTIAAVTLTATVRYDNLTRRYQLVRMVDGRIEDARTTEDRDAVRRWVTHFERVPLTSTTSLEPNGEYYVRVRARTRPRSTWFAWPWDRGEALGSARFTFIQ